MGGTRRHDSPTGVYSRSPESPKVAFAGVTGMSRPLRNDEHWSLYYFEKHAVECRSCHDPLKVSRAGKQLCDKGHQLAIDVASLIFRRKDGDVYSRTREEGQEVRVEIPQGYDQTLSLLRAIQRAIQKGERFVKPHSHDKHYHVPSRITTEKVKHDRKDEIKPASKPTKSYDTLLVEPTSPTRRPRERAPQVYHSDSKRGSLYAVDMGELERAEKREEKLRYNLEVRQPHSSHHRRHVPSVYV
ncbi:hypothetical protein EJ08DRAFT_698481 [Tothia fuscella]|uniref:Uncharacterized protein n=1 Tax=Tothia fuscella TaxID=1048955 RepID=A0A9P4NQB8_9PEZI|nr:hypothetical protein EJ08DRAFT_698481 [Tothia fuscella]